MKAKKILLAVAIAASVLTSLQLKANASNKSKSTAFEPDCPGTGMQCAIAPDGTIYVKGR